MDIGLRFADVKRERLTRSTEKAFDKGSSDSRSANLRENGASDAEVAFLLDRRVELNALPADRLVRFVERKLREHGVAKVMPGKKLMQQAYRAHVRGEEARASVERALAEAARDPAIAVPSDLESRVAALLKKHPRWRWDVAVAEIARRK